MNKTVCKFSNKAITAYSNCTAYMAKTLPLNNDFLKLTEIATGDFSQDFSQGHCYIKDTLKASDDFKIKQKIVWNNLFLYVKVYIFWKFIKRYTEHWEKTHMLKLK